MTYHNLPAGTDQLIYRNDSPNPLLVTVQIQTFDGTAKQTTTVYSTSNPSDATVIGPSRVALRTYLLASKRGIHVKTATIAQIDFDVIAAPLK